MNEDTLLNYYSQRAHEYERIYHKPERQNDLARLREHLRRLLRGQHVLELACGTGYWTAAIADTASSILAIDATEEVLEIARAKGLDATRVSFARGDAYHPPRLGDFTAGLAAFWWSHIPRARLPAFLDGLHASLLPGARVVFTDNCFVPGSSTPISRTDADGNTWQLRHLQDGSSYEVLKNFPSAEELQDTLQQHAAGLEIINLEYFWVAAYTLKGTTRSAEA